MKTLLAEILAAFQFLTRIPVPSPQYAPDLLSRASKFFPLVGFAVGFGGSLLFRLLSPFTPRPVVVLAVLSYTVLLTGAFHEDALADAADGFGGGWNRTQTLDIMRDSRIGSYGAIAIVLSLLWRFVLLSRLPTTRFPAYFIAAHVLCRWTTLPLSFVLPPARSDGEGIKIAQQTSASTVMLGSLLAFALVFWLLRLAAWLPITVSAMVTLLSCFYFWRRLRGVSGDCFGATNQITEIAVYLCGCLI